MSKHRTLRERLILDVSTVFGGMVTARVKSQDGGYYMDVVHGICTLEVQGIKDGPWDDRRTCAGSSAGNPAPPLNSLESPGIIEDIQLFSTNTNQT